MKKLLFIAIIPCVLFSTAVAQGDGGKGLHLGLKAGANLTKIEGEQFKDGFNFNYHAGAFIGIGLTDHFGVQPELIFSQSSSETGDSFSDIYNGFPDGNDQKIKLNYMSIPLLANIKLNKVIWLQLGPQYSILLNDHKSLGENGEDVFKKGDFSILGGLWIQTPIGINLSARYLVGLSDIGDINNQDAWKSQSFQLSIGYSFF